MLSIINDVIRITKGDTGRIDLTLVNPDNSEYKMIEGDSVVLSVKKEFLKPIIFQIEGPRFIIVPEMTSNLKPGKYVYDVQFTSSSGEVSTVIEPTAFYILDEVTDEIITPEGGGHE